MGVWRWALASMGEWAYGVGGARLPNDPARFATPTTFLDSWVINTDRRAEPLAADVPSPKRGAAVQIKGFGIILDTEISAGPFAARHVYRPFLSIVRFNQERCESVSADREPRPTNAVAWTLRALGTSSRPFLSLVRFNQERCESVSAVREPRPTNADTPKRRYAFFAIAAWAAAKRAIGNRNGLQLT